MDGKENVKPLSSYPSLPRFSIFELSKQLASTPEGAPSHERKTELLGGFNSPSTEL